MWGGVPTDSPGPLQPEAPFYVPCCPGRAAPYIWVAVEEYRERRFARLGQVARRAAREALETKEEVMLEPMSPADRKMVHMTLRSNLAVKTFSRGIEGDRAIVIVATEDAR